MGEASRRREKILTEGSMAFLHPVPPVSADTAPGHIYASLAEGLFELIVVGCGALCGHVYDVTFGNRAVDVTLSAYDPHFCHNNIEL